jgi:hypothetical protein
MYEKQLRPQVIIDQFAQKLLETSFGSQINLSATEKLISEITINSDPSGLAVFLASELLWQLPNLKPEVVSKIQLMKMEFINKDPAIADLNIKGGVLIDAIDQFCQQNEVQASYFQLEPLNDPNVRQILDFICNQTAANFQFNYSKEKKWLFQPYRHPKKNVPGVWMSQNNTPYSNNLLIELERAGDEAFQRTYLVPAALTSIKKHVPFQ